MAAPGWTLRGVRELVGAGCSYPVSFETFCLLLKKGGDAVNDLIQSSGRAEPGQGVQLFDGGHAAHHVLKARLVGLIVRHVLHGVGTPGTLPYSPRQYFDRDF